MEAAHIFFFASLFSSLFLALTNKPGRFDCPSPNGVALVLLRCHVWSDQPHELTLTFGELCTTGFKNPLTVGIGGSRKWMSRPLSRGGRRSDAPDHWSEEMAGYKYFIVCHCISTGSHFVPCSQYSNDPCMDLEQLPTLTPLFSNPNLLVNNPVPDIVCVGFRRSRMPTRT